MYHILHYCWIYSYIGREQIHNVACAFNFGNITYRKRERSRLSLILVFNNFAIFIFYRIFVNRFIKFKCHTNQISFLENAFIVGKADKILRSTERLNCFESILFYFAIARSRLFGRHTPQITCNHIALAWRLIRPPIQSKLTINRSCLLQERRTIFAAHSLITAFISRNQTIFIRFLFVIRNFVNHNSKLAEQNWFAYRFPFVVGQLTFYLVIFRIYIGSTFPCNYYVFT